MKKLFFTIAITFLTISLSAQFIESPTGVLSTFDRVGINTSTLDNSENNSYKLTLKGNLNVGGSGNARIKTRHIDGKDYQSSNKSHLFLNWRTGYNVYVGTHNTTGAKSNLIVSGKVRIGNDVAMPDGYHLYVKQGILTEKVKVAPSTSTEWADYVFADDYQLNSINMVEQFVKENKHLPNVPSAKNVAENGINVAEMDANLLRQIEELWLHTIQINKEKNELQDKYNELYERVINLEKK